MQGMSKKRVASRDINESTAAEVAAVTGQPIPTGVYAALIERQKAKEAAEKNPAAVALGRLGGLKGGKARAAKLTAKQRSEIAKNAAKKRWSGINEETKRRLKKLVERGMSAADAGRKLGLTLPSGERMLKRKSSAREGDQSERGTKQPQRSR